VYIFLIGARSRADAGAFSENFDKVYEEILERQLTMPVRTVYARSR